MNNIIKRKWNQNSMVFIEDLQGMAFQAESGGHTFQISGIDGEGNAVALSGTPAGVMLRADGQDVTLTCSASEGVVSATLPANAYSVPGRFGLTIFLTSDGQKTAIYAAVGTVGKTSSGTVAPPAGSDVVDLVNRIAAAVATIPASYTDLMAAMAPTYSSSGLYAVGNYAWYNGKLYRCTTPITSGETWTSGHWTLANLGSDLVDLKSALDQTQYLNEGLTLSSVNFRQGYIGNNGFIPSGGDSGKYISYLSEIKAPKGTIVQIESSTQYSIISVRQHNNWAASNTALQITGYAKNNSLKVEQDGYIVISIATSDVYAQRAAITPADLDAQIKIISNTEYMIDSAVLENVVRLDSDSFANGFLTNSGISTTGDYLRYLYYKSATKLRKGSVISFSGNGLVAQIALYASDSFTSQTTPISNHAFGNNYDFEITEDGYIFIELSTSASYGSRTPIKPSDLNIDIIVHLPYDKTEDHVNEIDNEIILLKNGKEIVSKTDFIQGYISNGRIIKTGDYTIYVIYIGDKINKGSIIKAKSDTQYINLSIYDKNVFDGTPVILDDVRGYVSEFEFYANYDGYPVITICTSPTYSQRVPITPADISADIIIYPYHNSNEFVPSFNEYYCTGEKISMKKNTGYYVNNSWTFVQPSLSGVQSGQGATIYDGVVFKCWHENVISAHKADTGETINAFAAASGHGNNISFSGVFYDENDRFPIAYVSTEAVSDGYALISALRLTTSSATLLKYIALPANITGGYVDAVVDPVTNKLYSVGYIDSSDTTSQMIVSVWDLNNLESIGDDKYVPDLVDTYNVPHIATHQGAAWLNGKIFMLKSEVNSTQTEIHVIDTVRKETVTKMTLFPNAIKNNECEGLWFEEDGNQYVMRICRLLETYRVYFED